MARSTGAMISPLAEMVPSTSETSITACVSRNSFRARRFQPLQPLSLGPLSRSAKLRRRCAAYWLSVCRPGQRFIQMGAGFDGRLEPGLTDDAADLGTYCG